MRDPSSTLNSPAEGTSAGRKSPHHAAVKTSMDCIQVRRRAAGIPGLLVSDLCTDSLTQGSSATRAAAQNRRECERNRSFQARAGGLGQFLPGTKAALAGTTAPLLSPSPTQLAGLGGCQSQLSVHLTPIPQRSHLQWLFHTSDTSGH